MIEGREIALSASRRVVSRSSAEAARGGPALDELLYETIFHESARLAHAPKDGRRSADHAYVEGLRRTLATHPERAESLYSELVHRYGDEIAGHFSGTVYRATTQLLPPVLDTMLGGPARRTAAGTDLADLAERVVVGGHVDELRALTARGTVVLVPTHVSHLDSVVLGLAIHRLGLPPFSYAAGLNLFHSRVLGFFMNHLGAFTVDRTKSDPTYKALLKEYTTVAIERGQHVLFFPGGTRSRSGGLETSLKKGLLGTALGAYTNMARSSPAGGRVFIVPCTCSYPLVLEAESLIDDHLNRTGSGRYLHPPPDESDRLERWASILSSILSLDLHVHIRFSAPLDPFGCAVDAEGRSLDPHGRVIDAVGYVREMGEVLPDEARDAEYTNELASRILSAYRRDNVVLSTGVVAFALFDRLRARHGETEIFRMLRTLPPRPTIPKEEIVSTVGRVLIDLRRRCERSDLAVASEVAADPASVTARGLRTLAAYHRPAAIEDERSRIAVTDPRLVLYYANRLMGYGLLEDRHSEDLAG